MTDFLNSYFSVKFPVVDSVVSAARFGLSCCKLTLRKDAVQLVCLMPRQELL